jgi:hypothetical protein
MHILIAGFVGHGEDPKRSDGCVSGDNDADAEAASLVATVAVARAMMCSQRIHALHLTISPLHLARESSEEG